MKELSARIADEIRRRGPIPFSRYMELCLYDPEWGYYTRSHEPFGKGGDFYTASDVHAVFGRLLARQFEEMWRVLGTPDRIGIIELGAGRGWFAQDVIDWSRRKFPEFFAALHYVLIESSPQLRLRLHERFPEAAQAWLRAASQGEARGAMAIIGSLDEVKPFPEPVIVFANEFFDALPVEVIDTRGELRIGLEGGRFVETFAPPTPQELEFLDRYGIRPDLPGGAIPGENPAGAGDRGEATLAAVDYMRRIATRMRRGFLVAIDYGYTREELRAGRTASTVRAFRQHALSDSPYAAPGEQDITAGVNFTALRAAGLAAGLDAGSMVTQAQFLMGIGETNQFADAFAGARLPQERTKAALQLKLLATPAGMGEAYRVLLMHRDVPGEKALSLSGLRYGRG